MEGNATSPSYGGTEENRMAVRTWVTARLENGVCVVTGHAAGTYQVDEDLSGNAHEREVSVSKDLPAGDIQKALQKALDSGAKELERAANRATMAATLKAEDNADKAEASAKETK